MEFNLEFVRRNLSLVRFFDFNRSRAISSSSFKMIASEYSHLSSLPAPEDPEGREAAVFSGYQNDYKANSLKPVPIATLKSTR